MWKKPESACGAILKNTAIPNKHSLAGVTPPLPKRALHKSNSWFFFFCFRARRQIRQIINFYQCTPPESVTNRIFLRREP